MKVIVAVNLVKIDVLFCLNGAKFNKVGIIWITRKPKD